MNFDENAEIIIEKKDSTALQGFRLASGTSLFDSNSAEVYDIHAEKAGVLVFGDANGDGEVNSKDSRALKMLIVS